VVRFGWRLPMWPADDTPGIVLVHQIENHLRRIEGAFQSVWLSDHFVPGNDWRGPEPDTLEAWSALCHFAAAFPAYTYGHIVLANSYRMPSLLAKMAATTQLLTRGRLILAIGAGWMESEYRAYGYEYPPPRVRIGQLDEAVQIIRKMWTESPASFEGKYYRIERAYCHPMPDPRPPILIGGAGEQLTLRVVAKWADWWNMPGGRPDDYRRKLDVLAEHCARVGRDPSTIVKTWETSVVAAAPTRAEAQRLAEASAFYAPAGPGASVVGEPGDVAEHLRRYVDLGVEHVILRFADFPSLRGILYFAEKVIPLLR
jgi:alkanesulfonate monooxygenase SsuD/methylene tetrahydromethanopterin reductase-like flavin-dependent oxidoreductase (luciferase family)